MEEIESVSNSSFTELDSDEELQEDSASECSDESFSQNDYRNSNAHLSLPLSEAKNGSCKRSHYQTCPLSENFIPIETFEENEEEESESPKVHVKG